MNELVATFKAGSSVDDALNKVYGLSRDKLDNDWRESVGLGPREVGEDRSTEIEDEVIAGPEVAEDEQSEMDSADGRTDRTDREVPADSDDDRDAAEQAAQSSQRDESESEQASDSRSEAEVAERTDEIQRRQDQRRSGPVFEAPAPFPWEYPLIGVAGALVLLSGLLLVRVLTPRRD